MCSSAAPALQAAGQAVFGDAGKHFQRPIDWRDQIDFHHAAEIFDRIERDLARRLVDFGGQRVAGDAGRGDEDLRDAPLRLDVVEHLAAKVFVGNVAYAGDGVYALDG